MATLETRDGEIVLTIGLDPACRAAISASLADLSRLVGWLAPDDFSDTIRDLGVTGHDLGNLIGREAIDLLTSGADELHGFQIKPGNGYLKLFTALANHAHAHPVSISHGWPILSPVHTRSSDAARAESIDTLSKSTGRAGE